VQLQHKKNQESSCFLNLLFYYFEILTSHIHKKMGVYSASNPNVPLSAASKPWGCKQPKSNFWTTFGIEKRMLQAWLRTFSIALA